MPPQLIMESGEVSEGSHVMGVTAGQMSPTERRVCIGVLGGECDGDVHADTHMCIPPEISSGRVIMLM